jgi:hypothetical protein
MANTTSTNIEMSSSGTTNQVKGPLVTAQKPWFNFKYIISTTGLIHAALIVINFFFHLLYIAIFFSGMIITINYFV